jgi:6-phosphogluconolactonase
VQATRFRSFPDATALEEAARGHILQSAADAIASRGRFRLVLAGGVTPIGVYRALRATRAQWPAWELFFSDERCLPPADPRRNSWQAAAAWLDHVPIAPARLHVMPAELGPERGAAAHAAALRTVGSLDLVLLGLGEDGHTAALFPGHTWGEGQDAPDVLPVHGAPKPPPERISLSAHRLSRATEVLFLVVGESKRAALARWQSGERIPAAAIQPDGGVDVWTAP